MNKNKLSTAVSISTLLLTLSSTANAVQWEVGDTKIDLYGYAKLDLIYDLDTDLGSAVSRSRIPLDGQVASENHFNIHAYQTRFGIKTASPTGQGDLKTRIEVDFWGSPGKESSSQILRLRHAYAEWNGILAGQTSSNFGPETAWMPTLDFYGQPAGPAGRVPQLRYTTGDFSVSAEDPEIAGGSVTSNADGDAKSSMPTLTASYKGKSGNLKYVLSGMVRELGYYDTSTGTSDKAYGWGSLVQASYSMGDTTVRAGISHGDGIGRQMYFNFQAPAYYDAANGSVETITATGIKASISHKIGPGAVNFGYSRIENDMDDAFKAGAVAATADEMQDSYYLNYIWSPAKKISYGLEVSRHARETISGLSGDAMRLQGSLQYFF